MKIAVIGAGIVGIATAYELASDGHEVSVFEQNTMAAEEASFANAGLIAPSQLLPLSNPPWPAASMMQLLRRQSRVDIRGLPSIRNMKWLWHWRRTQKAGVFDANWNAAQGLTAYSQARIQQIAANSSFEYERSDGQLALLHSEADQKSLQPLLAQLKANGVVAKEVSAEEARKIEPALNPNAAFHSAIHFPNDEVGNCRQFALLLKNEALKLGVQFHFNTEVSRIEARPGLLLHTQEGAHPSAWDSVVVCAGQRTYKLLAPLGIRLPVALAYGYTVSAAIGEPLNAPRSAVTDLQRKVSITRLGNRVRISGGAEIGGDQDSKHDKTIQNLYRTLQHYFPGAARYPSGTQVWKGARTLLPDGLPVIGASPIPGIWLNIGHGANGWGMSCGSARVIADLVQHKRTELDAAGLGMGRLLA